MNFSQHSRKILATLSIIFLLLVTTACGASVAQAPPASLPATIHNAQYYGQLERGNSSVGQNFGNWVVETSQGLIKDAYVRDNNKLGVVISSKVKPSEVKDLSKALAQGFRKNFPNQDLSVLIYAPDKKLILTALYDAQSKQVEFKQAG
jgi:hypothetical protein